MHIASVLSAISAIPSSLHSGDTRLSLSLRFALYILHVAYLVIHFSFAVFFFCFFFRLARESIAKARWDLLAREEQKNVIKINSNDKSNKCSRL
jgi:hypothetical protein